MRTGAWNTSNPFLQTSSDAAAGTAAPGSRPASRSDHKEATSCPSESRRTEGLSTIRAVAAFSARACSADESSAALSFDGTTLYFTSDRPGSGSIDLWVATRSRLHHTVLVDPNSSGDGIASTIQGGIAMAARLSTKAIAITTKGST